MSKIIKRPEQSASTHLSQKSHYPVTKKSGRIIGVNAQGLMFLTLLISLVFNYKLFQKFENLQASLAHLERKEAVSAVINQPPGQVAGRSPASLAPSGPSAFQQLNSIDLDQYVIHDYQSYSNYRYLLSDLSSKSRYFRTRVNEILDQYAKTHNIIGEHRYEYNRLLDEADKLRNRLGDKHEYISDSWRKNSHKYSSR